MFAEAEKEGSTLWPVSGIVPIKDKKNFFQAKVNQRDEELAAQVVAVPARVNIRQALSIDIASKNAPFELKNPCGYAGRSMAG